MTSSDTTIHFTVPLAVLLVPLGFAFFTRFLLRKKSVRERRSGFRVTSTPGESCTTRFQSKPRWVWRELVRLKARMPDKGCRHIAMVFNRLFARRRTTVGKTFVAMVVRESRREIERERRRWKSRKPRTVGRNDVWAIDITGMPDKYRQSHPVLGIIDHGTRRMLDLRTLHSKASIVLLRILIETIERFGTPHSVRTDNEAVFVSRLFRFGLWVLGIRHQRSELHCPWQNGRIERFFGTLKRHARNMIFDDVDAVDRALKVFRFWYDHVRPHLNLDGRTPWEAWNRIAPLEEPRSWRWFEEWDGILTGFIPEKGGS